MKKSVSIIILFFSIYHTVLAQKDLYKKQGFTIQNLKVDLERYESKEKVIRVNFDCKFKYAINDISKRRYKISVALKTDQGKYVYKNDENAASALARPSLDNPQVVLYENIDVFIPYKEIKVGAGEHVLMLEFNAQTTDYPDPTIFPKIFEKKVTLKIAEKKNVPYQSQEFTITNFRNREERFVSTLGTKVLFDVEFKYAYNDIENPKDLANVGEYYFYLNLKDTLGNVVYSPKVSKYEKLSERVKPSPNMRRGGLLVEELEFFIPYYAIQLPDSAKKVIVEIYVANSDKSFVFPVVKSQEIAIHKPLQYSYESQTFKIENVKTNSKQVKNTTKGAVIDFDCSFKFPSSATKDIENDPNVGHYYFYIDLKDANDAFVYQTFKTPQDYLKELTYTPYARVKSDEAKKGHGQIFIPFEMLNSLTPGSHTLTLQMHVCDVKGKNSTNNVYEGKVTLVVPQIVK